jgi:hypothetical protein
MFDATNLFPRLNLKLEIAEVDRRLSELGELANPTSSPPQRARRLSLKVRSMDMTTVSQLRLPTAWRRAG